MGINEDIQDALQSGDAETLTSLLGAEPGHDGFFELDVDCDEPEQRKAFLAAAIAVLPADFVRDLKLADNPFGLKNLGLLRPNQIGELFITLLKCAVVDDHQPMLERLHALEPKDSETIGSTMDVYGHELIANGDFAHAIEVFDLALKFPSPGTTIYANAMWAAQNDNTGLPIDIERNKRWLEACLPHGPQNAGVFFNAACVFMELGEHEKALEHIRLSIHYNEDASLKKSRELSADPMFDAIREQVDNIFSAPPKGVDSRAWWDEDDGEWVFGDKDEQGRLNGMVKYWRPGGTLCCATEHIAGEPNGTFTRYHESGEVSRAGHMKGSTLEGLDTATRSYEFTTEKAIPSQAPKNVHTIETHWKDGGFTKQVLRDIEGYLLTPVGLRVPKRPSAVPEEAFYLESTWHAGDFTDKAEKTGNWRYFDDEGVLLREEFYEDTQCVHTTLPSMRSDAAFERGVYEDGWMGMVLLLDEARNELGSFDSTGADLIRDPAMTRWVADVRSVDWAALESAYSRSERIAHHLVTFAAHDDAERREEALGDLYSFICHQGSTYASSAVALGLLVELGVISAHEDVQNGALSLVADMALLPRRAYDHWVNEGHEFDCVTAVSKVATRLQAVVLGADDSTPRWHALRCLAACFESPEVVAFLREDGRDEEEQAVRIACLGNLKAIPAATLASVETLAPLQRLAVVYGSALWWDGPGVPDGLNLIQEVLEEEETPDAFYAFPCVEGTVIDELPFMVQADTESVAGLTDKFLVRLTEVRGLGACPTVGAALQVVFAQEEFEVQQGLVLRAILAKDDLWLTDDGEPVRLINFLDIMEAWGFPTERDELAEFAKQWSS